MSPAAFLLLSAALSTVPGLAEQFRGVLEPNLIADSGHGANERFSFTSTRHRLGRRRLRVAFPPPSGSLFGHIPLELLIADRNLGFRPPPDLIRTLARVIREGQ